jgi:hypothetical protein
MDNHAELKEALDQAFHALDILHKPHHDPLNKESVLANLATYHLFPVKHNGVIIGGVFTKDNRFLVSVVGDWLPDDYIKQIVRPMLQHYGHITTSVMNYDTAGLERYLKYGFKVIGKDASATHLDLGIPQGQPQQAAEPVAVQPGMPQ